MKLTQPLQETLNLINLGLTPRQIAEDCDLTQTAVHNRISKLRQAGFEIPRFPKGPETSKSGKCVRMPKRLETDLLPHAEARGLTVRELAFEIIRNTIDFDLIAAVQGDGENAN